MIEGLWYKKSISPVLMPLVPLSLAFGCISALRKKYYQTQTRNASSFNKPPVVVVGNVSVGGTGKTPFIIWLVQLLNAHGIKCGIVSRGYKSQATQFPLLVGVDHSAKDVGDEPYMLFNNLACPIVIDAQRVRAVSFLNDNCNVDVILSDDGMQHYAMSRDCEIALVDGNRGLGNGWLLPAGPLREPGSRLSECDFVVANSGCYPDSVTMDVMLKELMPVNNECQKCVLTDFKGQSVHAVAGIGHPQRFFDSLQQAGLLVIPHEFPDHHAFSQSDIEFGDDLPVIMTEKDAVKCRQLRHDKLWYAPITATLPETFEQTIVKHIQALIDG